MVVKSAKNPGRADRVINGFIYIFLAIVALSAVLPILYNVSISLSDPKVVMRGEVYLLPVGLTLKSYGVIVRDNVFWISYRNTILYTAVGVIVRAALLMLTAYPLSRRKFLFRTFFSFYIGFTLLFNGGIIPTFVVVNEVGLINTFWAMIIPGAISAFLVIVVRTFFQNTIPPDLEESAALDGAHDFQILMRIVLPISAPIIAVTGLIIGVGIWNNYFQAILYLNSNELYPLTVILQRFGDFETIEERLLAGDGIIIPALSVRAATLLLSMLPVFAAYPFIQKHFVQGIRIGAIKG